MTGFAVLKTIWNAWDVLKNREDNKCQLLMSVLEEILSIKDFLVLLYGDHVYASVLRGRDQPMQICIRRLFPKGQFTSSESGWWELYEYHNDIRIGCFNS